MEIITDFSEEELLQKAERLQLEENVGSKGFIFLTHRREML